VFPFFHIFRPKFCTNAFFSVHSVHICRQQFFTKLFDLFAYSSLLVSCIFVVISETKDTVYIAFYTQKLLFWHYLKGTLNLGIWLICNTAECGLYSVISQKNTSYNINSHFRYGLSILLITVSQFKLRSDISPIVID
jgi:hypothetical protein